MVEVTCQQCGDTFEVYPYRAETARFCTRSCSGKASWKTREPPRVTLTCEQCGDCFEVKPAQADGRQFCSRQCAGRSRIVSEKRVCEGCGTEFKTKPGNPKSFCTWECAAQDSRMGAPPLIKLQELYWGRGMNKREIAEHFDCSPPIVSRWFSEHEMIERSKFVPSRKELEAVYLDAWRTVEEACVFYGVCSRTFRGWLDERGVEKRQRGEVHWHRSHRPTADQLRKHIYEEYLSYAEIADLYGVKGLRTVRQWLDKYEIERPGYMHSRTNGQHPDTPPADVLRILYLEWQMSSRHIADLYGVSQYPILSWLDQLEIPTRDSGFNYHSSAIAEDGTVVKSLYEMRTANWLHRAGLDYVYEPPTPFKGRYRADFFVVKTGWLIEVWGVKGKAEYDRRREKKERQYRRHNVPLLGLEVWHFDSPRNAYKDELEVVKERPGGQLSLFGD